jgi:hypothetical protein
LGDKNRITSKVLKSINYAGLGKERGEVVRIWGPDNRGVCPDIFVNFNKHTEDTF